MKLTTFIASGAMAMVLGSAAFADQSFTGTVTVLDRINNEVGIKQVPAGQTTGSTAGGGEVYKFRMRGALPESLHAEDKVTVTYTEDNGVKTITNLAPQ